MLLLTKFAAVLPQKKKMLLRLLILLILLPSILADQTTTSVKKVDSDLKKIGKELERLVDVIINYHVIEASTKFVEFKAMEHKEKGEIVDQYGAQFAKNMKIVERLLVKEEDDNKPHSAVVKELVQKHDPSHLFAREAEELHLQQYYELAPFAEGNFGLSIALVEKLKKMVDKIPVDVELETVKHAKHLEMVRLQAQISSIQSEIDAIDQIIWNRDNFGLVVFEAAEQVSNAQNMGNITPEGLQVEENVKKAQFDWVHHLLAMARLGVALQTTMRTVINPVIITTEELKALSKLRAALTLAQQKVGNAKNRAVRLASSNHAATALNNHKNKLVGKMKNTVLVALRLKRSKSLDSLEKSLRSEMDNLEQIYGKQNYPICSQADKEAAIGIMADYLKDKMPKELEAQPLAYLSSSHRHHQQHDVAESSRHNELNEPGSTQIWL